MPTEKLRYGFTATGSRLHIYASNGRSWCNVKVAPTLDKPQGLVCIRCWHIERMERAMNASVQRGGANE